MTELVTQAEAARRLGVKRQAIHRLVARGKLPLVGGKVVMDTAREVLAARLNPAQSKILRIQADQELAMRPPAEFRQPPADERLPDVVGLVDYAVAKAKREHHEAEIAAMRQRKMAGELVSRASVERVAMKLGRLVRDQAMGLPGKLAPELAAVSDAWEIERTIEAALRRLFDDAATTAENNLAGVR